MTLPSAISDERGQPSKVRVGTIVGVSPTLVQIQDTVYTDVGVLDSYAPIIGDTVSVVGQSSVSADGSSWLVLGKTMPSADAVAGPRLQAGELLVNFTTLTFTIIVVPFAQTFSSAPVVVTNIASAAGVTSSWLSRAFSITTTQFTLFLFANDGVARTWVNQPVQWMAHLRTQ